MVRLMAEGADATGPPVHNNVALHPLRSAVHVIDCTEMDLDDVNVHRTLALQAKEHLRIGQMVVYKGWKRPALQRLNWSSETFATLSGCDILSDRPSLGGVFEWQCESLAC